MFRTDTGNFNRFLTSLGLLLFLGALLVPYFYLHDTETLRIPVHELNGLTDAGRDALETRQQRQADLEVPVLVFASLLALCGIAAVWLGGRRLRVAQVKEDAAIDRKAKRDDVEIEQMSQSEVEEKREVQAREATDEEDRDASQKSSPEPSAPPVPTRNLADVRYREIRDAIRRAEETLRSTFEAMDLDSYEFLYEVKTSRASQQLQLDGLFRATKRTQKDVLLELKVIRQSPVMRVRTRQFADTVLALVARYQRLTKRRAVGWLVVLVPQEAESPTADERSRAEEQLNDSLVNMASATFIHESEIATLPERFLELFVDQAK